MARNSDNLGRLLSLVPYFLQRDGITMKEAAADLKISEARLHADLNQIFMCGLPSKYQSPDDLIDIQFHDGYVSVFFSAGMERPLRLTASEATVLLMSLRTLAQSQVVDPAAVARAIAKIEAAVSADARSAAVPDDVVDPVADEAGPTDTGPADAASADAGLRQEVYSTVRAAVRDERALRIRYYTPSRDEITERIVDPVGTQLIDRNTYLSAWCRTSEGMRLFRFDRIDTATALDEPAAPPPGAQVRRSSPIVADNPDLPTAMLDVDPGLRWVFDYYELDPVGEPDANGVQPARMTYGSAEWLMRFLLGFGGAIRLRSDGPSGSAADLDRTLREAATRARAAYA